jgi:FkbM family methyltransferase
MINLIDRLNILKNENFTPKRFLDIGANIGNYSKMIKEIWSEVDVFMVEANPHNEQFLKNTGYDYIISLLSDKISVYDFYLNKTDINSTGCSIYREDTLYFSDENLDVIKLTSNTLDNLFEDQQFDLIKIDTQGSEIDILKGGLNLISKSQYIIIEASLINYNIDAPLINDVLNFMISNNYMMIDVIELHYLNKTLSQIDILFKRKINKILNQISYAPEYKPEIINVLKLLKNDKKTIIDIGGSAEPPYNWSSKYIDAVVDILDVKNKLCFTGNICDSNVWDEVESYVSVNGKFDFSICTHTLEDISSPLFVCHKIEKISKSGVIVVPSKFYELSKHESTQYRGNIHHRWIFNIENDCLVGYPKISFIENSIFDKNAKMDNNSNILMYWNEKINIKIVNNDWLGPNPSSVIEYYLKLNE